MYKISKGQVWVIVIGAVLLWVFFLAEALDYSPEWWGGFGSILTPILVAFYIVGWKNYRKQNNLDSKLSGSWVSKILRIAKKAVIPVVILIVAWIGIAFYISQDGGSNSGLTFDQVRQSATDEYVGRFNRFQQHSENAQQCETDYIENKMEERTQECQADYDATYASYLDCKADMPWSSHYDCINWFDSDYESIDCSEEAIVEDLKSETNYCYLTVRTEYDFIVSFEKRLIDGYLDDLPADKFSLTQDEMEELYNKLPESVFNDKTKERFDEYVKKAGYSIQ